MAVVTEPGRKPIYNAVMGRHGWLLTSSADGYSRIWDWRTGRLLTSFAAGNAVSDSEFSSDGRRVVTASDYGTARIFSTELAGPIGAVETAARRSVTRPLTASEEKTYLGG
jgi:WD40 repeat protein